MEEKKDTEVKQELATKEQPLFIEEGLLTEDVLKKAEIQVEGIKKMKQLSIRVTNERDWSSQEGNPYLEIMGGMKIAHLWGITIIPDTKLQSDTIKDEKGEYIMVTCSGKARLKNGREVSDIGTCSTRDAFFGTVGGHRKDLADVDLENIKKKAVTNFQNRIIKKILGLSFVWEDLIEAKLNVELIKKERGVKYASGGAGGGKISEPQGKRLWAITKTAGKTEEQLRQHLKEKYQVEHIKDIDRKDYDNICTWAESKEPTGEEKEESNDNLISEITLLASKGKINSLKIAKEYINPDIDTLQDLTVTQLKALLRITKEQSGGQKR